MRLSVRESDSTLQQNVKQQKQRHELQSKFFILTIAAEPMKTIFRGGHLHDAPPLDHVSFGWVFSSSYFCCGCLIA